LTIKSISNTKYSMSFFLRAASPLMETCGHTDPLPPLGSLQILVVSIARQIFDFQRSDFFGIAIRRRRKSLSLRMFIARKNHLRFLRYC
jgi:hypothetical protein